MTTYTVVALIVLPVLGGFIAWAGDVIGYRLGKSRRSLLGLRPRTTARVVGIFVGVVLPLITMLLAAGGSSYVRMALFQLAQLKTSRDLLLEQNTKLVESVRQSKQQEKEARQAAAEAQARYEETQAALGDTEHKLATVKGQLSRAEAQLRQKETRLREVEAERERLQEEVAQIEAKLHDTEAQLAASEQHLAEAHQSLVETQDRYQQLQEQEQSLQKTVNTLTSEVNNLRAEVASLQMQRDGLERQVEDLNQAVAQQKAKLQAKQLELDKLGDELQAREIELLQRRLIMAAGEVIYEPGDELLRGLIGTDQSEAQIESSLNELLVLASERAAAEGVGREAASNLHVQLVSPRPPGVPRDTPLEELREIIIPVVAREISRTEAENVAVVVRVLTRSFVGDGQPVVVELRVRPNVRVWQRGEVITRQEIDGTGTRAEVFRQVWGLLGQLRRTAQQAGVMRAPETGQYGVVPAEQLLALFDEVVTRQEVLTAEAVAAEDVYVASRQPFLVLLRIQESKPREGEAGEPGPGPRT